MSKYDSQLVELKNLLPAAKNILIVLPANANIDTLASGLALFLTLQGSGKQVSIVCDDVIKVGQSHLFGVDHIQKNIPSTEGGNLTITLEGVAASDNTIPALEKLDWSAGNNNLNLVFHVLPGQTFQPSRIVPHYQGSGFNLIFVIGAANLNELGNIYQTNSQVFSGTVVNIDNQTSNTSFGQTNVLDTNASSVSEIVSSVITDLGSALEADSASNLIAGIFDATNNLTDNKANAETYMAVANCLRVGGRKPHFAEASRGQPGVQTSTPSYDWTALMPKGQTSSTQPQTATDYTVPPVVTSSSQPMDNSGDDSLPATATQNALPAGKPSAMPMAARQAGQPSPEERPLEEGVVSETVEPEWLTPKIFKGSSLG